METKVAVKKIEGQAAGRRRGSSGKSTLQKQELAGVCSKYDQIREMEEHD